MARIAFLAKNPKRALGSLAVLVAATGVVIGSGANFTASSANPSNTFAAGTLSILNDKEGAAILTPSGDLIPGGTWETGVVDIQNDGSIAGDFTLARGAVTNTDAGNPLSAVLNVVVTDCGAWSNPSTVEACGAGGSVADTVLYTGTVDGMTTEDLGTFAPDAKHRYEFRVQLDASATDAHQGGETTVTFDWDAVQS